MLCENFDSREDRPVRLDTQEGVRLHTGSAFRFRSTQIEFAVGLMFAPTRPLSVLDGYNSSFQSSWEQYQRKEVQDHCGDAHAYARWGLVPSLAPFPVPENSDQILAKTRQGAQ